MTLENQFLDHICDKHSSNLFLFYLIQALSERKEEATMVRGQTHGRMRQNLESIMRWKQKKNWLDVSEQILGI